MKRDIKAFMPDFRPSAGPDASFDLLDFQDREFAELRTSFGYLERKVKENEDFCYQLW